jgi:hypothetical protein
MVSIFLLAFLVLDSADVPARETAALESIELGWTWAEPRIDSVTGIILYGLGFAGAETAADAVIAYLLAQ